MASKQFPVFLNDGASCYANSVLQALGVLPRLAAAIEHEVALLPGAWSHLSELLKEFCWDENRLSHAFMKTTSVRQELSQLTGKLQYADKDSQEDAHQFMMDIIAQLPPAIGTLFNFRIFYHRVCSACDTPKGIGEGELSNVLVLNPEQEQQFKDLLQRCQEQTMSQVWCSSCQVDTYHRERAEFRIGNEQQYLLVHMSPFGVDNSRLQNRQIRGFQANHVQIFGKRFRTVAAIQHTGLTPASAHYTCLLRSTGGWTKVDDKQRQQQERKNFVANLKDISLLFMEKV